MPVLGLDNRSRPALRGFTVLLRERLKMLKQVGSGKQAKGSGEFGERKV